jgi:prepilin-type N-terminal cleavage/methylation domain-containing protein
MTVLVTNMTGRVVRLRKTDKQRARKAFTLVEVVMSLAILGLAMAGMVYGYVQTNYRSEWSSMSLAAQSSAVEAVEQARAAQWDVHVLSTDQLPAQPPYTRMNTLFIPQTGASVVVTNTVWITNVSTNPPLRQIRADCWWQFPSTKTWFSNTVITWRAPDE